MQRRVEELMTRVVEVVTPEMTARDVATRMRDRNIGSYPVCEEGFLVGMVTYRDLALRILAEGRDAGAVRVDEVMTRDLACCAPDDPLEEVLGLMASRQVRRVPVVDSGGKLVGLMTLGKVAETDCEASGEALKEIVQSGGLPPEE